MEKTLFLVRGLPGSGKTTFAKQLSDVVFEADMYFESDGEYKFDPSKIRDAHEWCKGHVRQWMQHGEKKIAVSNTFTQEWEMEDYFKMAEKYQYNVVSLIVENRHGGKNIHGVPDEKLDLMKNRFQIKLT